MTRLNSARLRRSLGAGLSNGHRHMPRGLEAVRLKGAGIHRGFGMMEEMRDNKVIVIDRYPDMATMERFLANPEFKEAMAQAGVTAPPTVLIGLAT